ncbi:MAG: AAA family ATPase, partial [Candidatus Heimdallarchaeota archaeon]|nr:AAA family ATPase [Candidatus Heimdallarchaeota archaeon]
GEGNIREYLAEFLNLKSNTDIEFNENEIDKLIEFFELPTDLLEKNIEDISGGEKQRFAIITSIILNRDIYLLDEITSGLDADMKQKVADFFVNVMKKTLIIVSHDEIWTEFPEIRVITINGAKK